MSEAATPPLVDPAPRTPPSPKVILAAAASFLAPTIIIVLDYLLGEGRGIFTNLPVIAQIAIFSLITSASTLVAGYMKRDKLREAGARVLPKEVDR
jgi:hypothetical protein